MLTIVPDHTTGMHTRTKYDSATGKVVLTKAPLFSPLASTWTVDGAAWTASGDYLTCNNTDASDRFLSIIWHVNQSVAEPITFRVKAYGENIAGPASTGFSIYIGGSYNPAGGTYDAVTQTNFPAGTWKEAQFTATITPSSPVTYVYLYVFARDKTGILTVRDLEVLPTSGTTATKGEWVSDVIDLAASANEPVPVGATSALNPQHVGFYYGDLVNLDNRSSTTHIITQLSKFDVLVIDPANLLSASELSVATAVIAAGVNVFGYTASTSSDATIHTAMDACAANGYYGAFIDEAGYDWSVSRTRFNGLVDYAHALGLKVFANSWVPADVLSSVVNATYNPSGTATKLTTDDWVLLESFYTRSDNTYAGTTDGFASVWTKYTKSVSLAKLKGVKIACLAYHMNTVSLSSNVERDRSYILAMMLGLDGWCYGATSSDNSFPWTEVPDIQVGASINLPTFQLSSTRFERDAQLATLWLTATDSPATRNAGYFRRAVENPAKQIDTANFTATRVTVNWETVDTIPPLLSVAGMTPHLSTTAEATAWDYQYDLNADGSANTSDSTLLTAYIARFPVDSNSRVYWREWDGNVGRYVRARIVLES